MTPDQLKAARALLGWSFDRLGAQSSTSAQLVSMFEKTGRTMSMKISDRTDKVDALAAIRTALEAAGVEFMNGDAPGVRLRKPHQ